MQNQNPTHYPALIFSIFALHVYSLVPWGTIPLELNNFWWKDEGHPQGRGPFNSLKDCMQDFEHAMRGTLNNTDEKSNVIHVDFTNKRRK